MGSFILKNPAAAVRYERNQNEDEVASLLRNAGHTGFSTTNQTGVLKIYNGGLNLEIEDGAWVVTIGESVATLTNNEFIDLFSPAPTP